MDATNNPPPAASDSEKKNWRATALGAAVIVGLGLYFFTLTAVVMALICAFVGVVIAFYFLNALQYAARSEGKQPDSQPVNSTRHPRRS